MMYCVAFSYMTFYLLKNDFTTAQVGVINAVFWLLATLLQPVLGQLVDRLKQGWRVPMFVMYGIALATSIAILLIPVPFVRGILYGTFCISIGSTRPLVNTICFTSTEGGTGVNFGSARGTGSITFAVLSLILGELTLIFDSRLLPISLAVLCVFMIVLIACSKFYRKPSTSEVKKKPASLWVFFQRYPMFIPVWIGSILMMIFHCMTNTYLLQIVEKAGGNSSTMGIALAIAAVMELPVMFGFAWINKKMSCHRLLLFSAVFFVLKGALYYFTASVWAVYVAQGLQMLSFAVYANAGVCYANDTLQSEDIGLGQSLIGIASSAGSLISGLLGGYLIDYHSVDYMLFVGLMIAIAAVAILLGSVITERVKMKQVS